MSTEKIYDVVIATSRNKKIKGGSIRLALDSIRKQVVQPHSIIVVSNGNDKEENLWLQTEVCKAYEAQYVEGSVQSRAAARNVGIESSRSPFILFMDDDIIVTPAAVEIALSHVSENYYCCGAHRRYLPTNIPLKKLRYLIDTNQWDVVDQLANDQPVSDSGYRQRFRRFPHQSTFLCCFGIVSRRIAAEIRFDERYSGWGLEDTDFMRRLLNRIGFRSIADAKVYHIDHLVSPYIWDDHWGKNFQLYLEGIGENGYLRVFDLFQNTECPPKSSSALLLPTNSSGSDYKHLSVGSKDRKLILEEMITECRNDNNAAALILTGSTLHNQAARDLDIVRVNFGGDSGFDKKDLLGTVVEEQVISIPSLESTLFHPEWFPDTWLWIAGRYVNGSYLWMRVDVESFVRDTIRLTLARRLCHFLTYHLGSMVRCIQKKDLSDKLTALKHIVSILCLWKGEYPDRMEFPYTSNPNIALQLRDCKTMITKSSSFGQEDLLAELTDPVIEIIRRGALESTVQRVFLPDSFNGLEIIRAEQWGRIEFNWGKIFR